MRRLTSMGCSCTSNPATLALPSVGGRKQVRMRMVVVFPAPLGPRKPTICPFSTSKEMLSTATVRAYLLVRPSTLIILRCPGRKRVWLPFLGEARTREKMRPARLTLKFHHTDGGQLLSNQREGRKLRRRQSKAEDQRAE